MNKSNPIAQVALPELSAPAISMSTSSVTDWRRLFSLKEMGVYYALILLVVSLAFLTAYLGKAA